MLPPFTFCTYYICKQVTDIISGMSDEIKYFVKIYKVKQAQKEYIVLPEKWPFWQLLCPSTIGMEIHVHVCNCFHTCCWLLYWPLKHIVFMHRLWFCMLHLCTVFCTSLAWVSAEKSTPSLANQSGCWSMLEQTAFNIWMTITTLWHCVYLTANWIG